MNHGGYVVVALAIIFLILLAFQRRKGGPV
jgi:preprotein translocase subunit SecG